MRNKNSTIFKTFENDIDKVSAKWGIFGRSFNDIGIAITGRISDINKGFRTTNNLLDVLKSSDSVFKRLYPTKEDIDKAKIAVPELIDTAKANEYVEIIKSIDDGTMDGIETFQQWYDTLADGDKWIAQYAQKTKGQIRSIEGVTEANKVARESAIAHNNALKQQTLGAKAATVVMKALSIAGNMIIFTLIAKGIELATKAIDNWIHRVEKANEAIEESRSEYEDAKSDIESMNSELETTKQKITELESKGVLSFTDEEELERLRQQNDELERSIQLEERKKKNSAAQAVNKAKQKKETLVDDFDERIQNYKTQKETYEEADKTGKKLVDSGAIPLENYEEQMASEEKALLDYEKSLLDKIEKFEQYKEDLINRYDTDDISEYSPSDRDWYEEITQKLQEAYELIYSDAEYNKFVIEPIFDKEKFKGLQDKLLQYFVDGGSSNLKDLENKFGTDIITALKNACESAGIDFDKMIEDIYNNSQQKLNQIAPIIDKPSSSFDAKQNSTSKNIRDFIQNELSEEDRTILLNAEIPEDKKFETIQDVINFINSLKEKSEEEPIISFKEAWNSLKSVGENSEDLTEELLELAQAGKLTPEVLESNEQYAELLKSVGNNAEIAADKINKMVEASDQLSSMKSGISSISDVLAEKKDNLSHKKTKEVGIGADKLAGFDAEIKGLDSWDKFEQTLGNGKSSMEECQKAANKLATEWVNSNNFLAKLNDTNVDYYKSTLAEMGVENADEVVTAALAQKKADLNAEKEWAKATTLDLANATAEEINQLASEQTWSNETKDALYRLALQKQIANGIKLNTADDIDNLSALCGAISDSGEALSALAKYKNMLSHGSSYSTTEMANAWRAARDAANKVANKKNKVKVDVKPSVSSGSSGSGSKSKKDSGSKTKDTKQTFDWLERKVNVLNSKLDLLKAKIENVFTVQSKNSFIDKEIKKTNALINVYKKQAKAYKQQAAKSAKSKKTVDGDSKTKLSASLKKKIKNGQIKGTRKQLIKAYGEKTANAIQEFQEYWDKYQEARTNIQSARTNRRELKIQKQQNWVDYYDAMSEQYQAEIDNLYTAKSKNKLEKQKLDYIKKSYDKQIAIANLEQDSVKAATLLAQKWKEIADTREQILQNTLDENAAKRDYNNAAYENADNATKKKLIQSNIDSRNSDKTAYADNVSGAKSEAADKQKAIATAGKAVTNWMNKNKLNSSMKKKIQGYINKGARIPDDLMNNLKIANPALYDQLDAYNSSIDTAQLGSEAIKEAQDKQKLSNEEIEAQNREDRSKLIQLDIDSATNTYDRLASEYENLFSVSAKNANIDEQLQQQSVIHQRTLDQLKNDITDAGELANAIAKENAEWEKLQREQRITQLENLADEQNAQYELNQQLETNADTAKEKNKYEAKSRDNLKKEYEYQIQIAKENQNIIEQDRLRAELEEKIEESYKKQIENIREEYDLILGMNDARKSTIESQISALQANGYGIGTDLYKIQIELDKASYEKSIEEIARIEAELPNLTGQALEQEKINLEAEKQAAWGYQQSMAEAQQAINDINLAKFERLKTLLEYISDELDYIQTILSHSDFTFSDKGVGGLTIEGLSNMAIDFAKMSNNVEQIDNLYTQIAEKQRQLDSGEYVGNGDQLKSEINALIQEIHDLESANYDLGESIKSLVIDSLNSLADALDESISKYKDALQAQKDLYDYRRKVADQLKSIASLEKQLAALQGSDTEEARARIQKLQVELADEQQNLKDMEYDKYIQDQQDMLDKVSDDFQDFIAAVADMSVNDICAGMADAIQDNLNDITSSIQESLDKSATLGSIASGITGLSEVFKNLDYAGKEDTSVDKNGNSHYQYTDNNGNVHEIITDSTGTIIGAKLNGKDVDISDKDMTSTAKDIQNAEQASSYTKGISTTETSNKYGTPNIYKVEANKKYKDLEDAIKNWNFSYYLNPENSDVVNEYVYDKYGMSFSKSQEKKIAKLLHVSYKNKDKLLEKLKQAGYSQGGIVSELNKVALANGDDGWATLKRGESVLTPEQTEQFRQLVSNLKPLNNVADAMKLKMNAPMPTKTDFNNQTQIDNIDIHLDGSNVVDPDSFIKTLHNPRVLKEVSNGVSSQIGTKLSNRLSRF